MWTWIGSQLPFLFRAYFSARPTTGCKIPQTQRGETRKTASEKQTAGNYKNSRGASPRNAGVWLSLFYCTRFKDETPRAVLCGYNAFLLLSNPEMNTIFLGCFCHLIMSIEAFPVRLEESETINGRIHSTSWGEDVC